jgi:fructose-1,6-bisphosphatase/inositol monophosphatase family enzyme
MDIPGLQTKVTKVMEIVRKEGLALLCANPSEVWRQKPDGSFYSQKEVDLEKRMRNFLLGDDMFPEANFIGEETDPSKELEKGRANIVLDPLDGSALNRAGIPVWGISLAILDENLRPAVAVLFYPAMNRWYLAVGENGRAVSYGVDCRTGASKIAPDEGAVERAVPPENLKIEDAYLYTNSKPTMFDLSKLKCKTRAFGCTSFHIAALVDGRGDPFATVLHGYRIYDIAAALAIAEACGLAAFDLEKNEIVGFADLISLPRKQLDCRPLLVGHPSALFRLEGQVRLAGQVGCNG